MNISKLVLQITAKYIIMCLLILGLILLPREPQYIALSQFHIEVKYHFSFGDYINRLNGFFSYIRENNGLGTAPEGITYGELVQRYTIRTLQLVIPSFLLTIFISFLFCFLEIKRRVSREYQGKPNPYSILFTLPDFFIFILIQYLLILLGNSLGIEFDIFGNDRWFHFILPSIILSIYPSYYLSKVLLTLFTKELKKDYINTARSKGTANVNIVGMHMFRNTVNSILSHVYITFIYLISSLPIIELLSAYNGLGNQLIVSIKEFDDIKAIAFVLPFITIIFSVKLLIDLFRHFLIGNEVGEGEEKKHE